MSAQDEIYCPPKKQEKKEVSWGLKLWKDFTEQDRKGLTAHLRTMTRKEAAKYVTYLHTYCGAPHVSEWKILDTLS